MKTFPILLQQAYDVERDTVKRLRRDGALLVVVAVPWDLMVAHEKQCLKNHSQTVKRLAERGGLSLCEAVAVLEDRDWTRMSDLAANERLLQIVGLSLFVGADA